MRGKETYLGENYSPFCKLRLLFVYRSQIIDGENWGKQMKLQIQMLTRGGGMLFMIE